MSSELTRSILGSIRLNPALLESVDLRDLDFDEGRDRKTFGIITELWEDGRPLSIDPVVLLERLGGNGASAYVGSLTDGLNMSSAEVFARRVFELRKNRLALKMSSAIKRELELHLKTGQAVNFDPIRGKLAEWDSLSQSEEPRLVPLVDYQAEHLEWLWPGRIPFGMLTLLVGSPGVGKSFLTVAIASMLSKGEPLPDTGDVALKCSSLFLAAEDPPSEIRLRADASGADCSKIIILDEDEPEVRVEKLKRGLCRNSDIRLLVIDPLNSYLPAGTDYFRDPDVRRKLLRPLAQLAQGTKAAILAVAHLNKNEDAEVIHRIGGTIGYSAAARSVLAIGLDADDEERRLLLSLKCNYTKKPNALAFRIAPDLKLAFDNAPVEVEAEEVLSRQGRADAGERSFALNWLNGELQNGPLEFRDLDERRKKVGISRGVLYRAAKRLRVHPHRQGVGRAHTSTWELPHHGH
jgi:hypothetical protein